jgi:hypothetical protein
MRVLIVHESFFGNTGKLAEAMGAALQRGGHDVSVVHAADVATEAIAAAELLMVGAPTHAHNLPRPSTRGGAVQQGAAPDLASRRGVRELLDALREGQGTPAAAFDTRVHMPRWLSGAASRPIAAALRRRGYWVIGAESFFVDGTRGPLRKGELERGQAWVAGVLSDASALRRRAA